MNKIKKVGVLGGSFDPPTISHLQLCSEALNILKFDEKTAKNWKQYNVETLSFFRNPDNDKQGYYNNYGLYSDGTTARPVGTGIGFEYSDLSGDYFNKFEHVNQSFKGCSFNGADLSCNVFIQCNFSRCTFIGANIASCVFHGCSFLGEEVNFAGCSSNDDTLFIDCRVEDIGDWTPYTDINIVRRCLEHRLLKDTFDVISVGSFES